jgi:hypothetical protein
MDDDFTVAALSRLEEKIDGLEKRLAEQAPMTPVRAAAEARENMARDYAAKAADREAAKAAKGGGAE